MTKLFKRNRGMILNYHLARTQPRTVFSTQPHNLA